jgi:xanthine/uracil permease
MPWQVNGALIAASVVHILIGVFGLLGFLMRYIGPLTVIPTVALLGLSLFETGSSSASVNWGISLT